METFQTNSSFLLLEKAEEDCFRFHPSVGRIVILKREAGGYAVMDSSLRSEEPSSLKEKPVDMLLWIPPFRRKDRHP